MDKESSAAEFDGVPAVPQSTSWLQSRAARRFMNNHLALLGLGIFVLLIITAALAPMVAPYDPTQMHSAMSSRLAPPSAKFPLGTDQFGRDTLSRIVFGARISLEVGIISVGIATIIGSTLGLAAGYYKGLVDMVLSRIMDVMFAFPAILMAIAIMAILGSNLQNVMIAIGIVNIPIFFRVTRGATLSVAEAEYVRAARSLGSSDLRIMVQHLLPNIAAPVIVQITLSLAFAILAEASLSFLGLGTQPPTPSWGIMLNTGRNFMTQSPWVAVFPGAAIMVTVLGLNLLGDGLRDALDPRLSK